MLVAFGNAVSRRAAIATAVAPLAVGLERGCCYCQHVAWCSCFCCYWKHCCYLYWPVATADWQPSHAHGPTGRWEDSPAGMLDRLAEIGADARGVLIERGVTP